MEDQSDRIAAAGKAPAGPLPWPIVRLLAGTGVSVTLASALVDPALAMAAAGGLAAGMGGTVMGSVPRAAGVAAVVLAVFALGLAGLDPRLAALALAALAGLEAARTGGRAVVHGIFAITLLAGSVGAGAAAGPAALAFALSAAAGLGAIRARGLVGLAAPPPEGARGGWRVGLFLGLGLLVSLVLIGESDEPRTVWILYIFVMRALSPADAVTERTLVYATGAVAGGVLALLLGAVGPPVWLSLGLAAVALTVGLRFAPALSPLPGAGFTLAVLLVVAPGPGYAVFRIEVVLMVALFALALAEGLRAILAPRGR